MPKSSEFCSHPLHGVPDRVCPGCLGALVDDLEDLAREVEQAPRMPSLAELLHHLVVAHQGSLVVFLDGFCPCVPPADRPDVTTTPAVEFRASVVDAETHRAHASPDLDPQQLEMALRLHLLHSLVATGAPLPPAFLVAAEQCFGGRDDRVPPDQE